MHDRFITIACHEDRRGSIIGYRILDTETGQTKDVTRRSAENAAAGISKEMLQIVSDRSRYPCIACGKVSGIKIKTAYAVPDSSGIYMLSDYKGGIEKATEKDIMQMLSSSEKSVSNMKMMYGRLYKESMVTDINEISLDDKEKEQLIKRMGKRFCIIKAKVEACSNGEALMRTCFAVDFKTLSIVNMGKMAYLLGISWIALEGLYERGEHYLFKSDEAADNIMPVHKAYTFEKQEENGTTALDKHILPVCEAFNRCGEAVILASKTFRLFNSRVVLMSIDSIVKKNTHNTKSHGTVYRCTIDKSKGTVYLEMAAESRQYDINKIDTCKNSKVSDTKSIEVKSRLAGKSMTIEADEDGVITHIECADNGDINIPKGSRLGRHAITAAGMINRVAVPGDVELIGNVTKSSLGIGELWLEDARIYGSAISGFSTAVLSKISVGSDINGYELYGLSEMLNGASKGIEIRGGISDSALDKFSELVLDWEARSLHENKIGTAEVIEAEKINTKNITSVNIRCGDKEEHDGEYLSTRKGVSIKLTPLMGQLSAQNAKYVIRTVLNYEQTREKNIEKIEAEIDRYVINYSNMYKMRSIGLTEKIASKAELPIRLKAKYQYLSNARAVCDLYRTDMGAVIIGVIESMEELTQGQFSSFVRSSDIDVIAIPENSTVFAFGAEALSESSIIKKETMKEINSMCHHIIAGKETS